MKVAANSCMRSCSCGESTSTRLTPRGRYTRSRDGRATEVLSRAPLVPIGSLMTCTRMSSPALTRRRMSSTGGALASGAPTTVSSAALPAMSAACRNAVRSRPISTNAACMPGSTRDTRPLYRLLTSPRRLKRSMWISCTTPFSRMAARDSRGAMLTRISMLNASGSGMRLVRPVRNARFREQLRRLEERQAHDAGVTPGEVFEEHRAAPLDRVAPGLVAPLAGAPVGQAFRAGEGAEAHHTLAEAHARRAVCAGERPRGQHPMGPARESLEHGDTRVFVGGLAEELAVDHHDGIGGQHRERHAERAHGERLAERQAPHVVGRALPGQRRLVDVRSPHHVRHADLLEQRAAPGGARGEA